MLYVINREDTKVFKPAIEVDPTYAKLLKEAKGSGVEIFAYACKLSPDAVTLTTKVEVEL